MWWKIQIPKSLKKSRLHFEIKKWKTLEFPSTYNSLEMPIFLIATSIGANLNALAMDMVLAQALKSRGHNVKLLLCDGSLSACMNCEINKFRNVKEFIDSGPSKLCLHCKKIGKKVAAQNSVQVISIGSLQNSYSTVKHEDFSFESAVAGAKRFLASGNENSNDEFNMVLDRFVKASADSEQCFESIVTSQSIRAVIAHHGIYVPQGNIVRVCQQRNIPVITWNQAYRKGCYIFSLNDTYHKTLLKDFDWDRSLSSSEITTVREYLGSRDSGQNDWIRFGRTTASDSKSSQIAFTDNGYDLLLTNVSWDAQVHYDSNIFHSMFDWLRETILWYQANPSQNLIIRVHPAEKTGAIVSKEPVADWVTSEFGELPNNIQVIDALDEISTYLLIKNARIGLIYATKTGIEMAAQGKPIVVAGESWIRKKGFAYEPESQLEYIEFLEKNKLLNGLPSIDAERALRFAYYFFFERMVEIKSIKPLKNYPYARPVIDKEWESYDLGLLKVIQKIENGQDFN